MSNKRSFLALLAGAAAGAGASAAALRKKPDVVVGQNQADRMQVPTSTASSTTPVVAPVEEHADGIEPFDRSAAGIDTPKAEKGPKGKVMSFAEKHNWTWLGRALQVQRRFGEIQGSNIASSVALQLIVALFPLLLVTAAIIGFVASGSDTDVAGELISSLGLSGESAEPVRNAVAAATDNRGTTSILGLVTLVWSALGITSALQYAYNQAWQSGGRGVKDKAVGLLWLICAAFLFVATAAVTTVINWLPFGLGFLAAPIGVLLSFCLWMLTGKLLPRVDVSWRDIVPGAIAGALGLEVLKLAGALWVPRAIESSSSNYGAGIGVALAVIAFVVLFGKLVVYTAVLNVITYEAKHGVVQAVIEVPKASAPEKGITRGGDTDTP